MSNGTPGKREGQAEGPGAIATAEKVTPHAESFESAFTDVYNEIFKVVFFPDRIYHERYLNATRSPRYRYNVREVRSYLDITAMKSQVYLDGKLIGNVLRIEYGASRLVEQIREKQRFLQEGLIMWIQPLPDGVPNPPSARVRLAYDIWTHTFQVEIWETLEAPEGTTHAFSVLDQMGRNAPITRVPQFDGMMAQLASLNSMELAFREDTRDLPFGFSITDEHAAWDNAFLRSHQEPVTSDPSSPGNTILDQSYRLDFQRGWYVQAPEIVPVRYLNAMMDSAGNPDAKPDNIIEMRWIFQREFGGSMIFFHHVTIPPGHVEGNHQHIGSEELYYIVEGEGIAYLRVGDDPATDAKNQNGEDVYPIESRMTMGLGYYDYRRLPVKPGSVIFTKSGGMHGIRNTGGVDLKFVAFLYHST
jgi:mannose-6-phosphate isomerase-like protein (cupin superfamily)